MRVLTHWNGPHCHDLDAGLGVRVETAVVDWITYGDVSIQRDGTEVHDGCSGEQDIQVDPDGAKIRRQGPAIICRRVNICWICENSFDWMNTRWCFWLYPPTAISKRPFYLCIKSDHYDKHSLCWLFDSYDCTSVMPSIMHLSAASCKTAKCFADEYFFQS